MVDDHLTEASIAAHDRQRQLPPEVQDALIGGLCSHLRGLGWCLDAGVGTGSVATPLAQAGISVIGVDFSRSMLDTLRARHGETTPIPLVRGNLTRLPFRNGVFGGTLAANVFHLIPAWRTAASELVRVVRPGGLLLINLGSGGATTKHGRLIMAKFRDSLGAKWPADAESPGPRNVAEFETCVLAHGAEALPSLKVEFQETTTTEGIIARLERNPFARPVVIDQAALHRAASATKEWARERFGPLDAPLSGRRVITYRIYKLPR